METASHTLSTNLSRAEVDALKGPVMLEFGAAWCGYCKAAQPLINEALSDYPHIQHIRIEDGKGKSLGRSYRVTLWPTLVFLINGQEATRLVRPVDTVSIRKALGMLCTPGKGDLAGTPLKIV